MSVSINRVLIAGNLTRDPQVKVLPNERTVAEFGIAINERYKDKDGNQKETVTFVDIVAWGRTAELVGQYLSKGKPVFVEGRIKQESFTDKDGNKRSKTKVTADSVQFLGAKGSDMPPTAPAPAAQLVGPATPSRAPDDEPPFDRYESRGMP